MRVISIVHYITINSCAAPFYNKMPLLFMNHLQKFQRRISGYMLWELPQIKMP